MEESKARVLKTPSVRSSRTFVSLFHPVQNYTAGIAMNEIGRMILMCHVVPLRIFENVRKTTRRATNRGDRFLRSLSVVGGENAPPLFYSRRNNEQLRGKKFAKNDHGIVPLMCSKLRYFTCSIQIHVPRYSISFCVISSFNRTFCVRVCALIVPALVMLL